MSRQVIRRTVELNESDVEWFEKQFPKASLNGTLQMLLSKFREVNEFTPEHYAKVAALALTEEIRS